MDINGDAPVITRDEIVISAPIQAIWDIQTDVAGWPSWQPDVDGADADGPLAEGSAFRWQTAGLDITSTVEEVAAPHRIVWGGPAQGIVAVHVWTLEEQDDGVLVRTAESWEGEPVSCPTRGNAGRPGRIVAHLAGKSQAQGGRQHRLTHEHRLTHVCSRATAWRRLRVMARVPPAATIESARIPAAPMVASPSRSRSRRRRSRPVPAVPPCRRATRSSPALADPAPARARACRRAKPQSIAVAGRLVWVTVRG